MRQLVAVVLVFPLAPACGQDASPKSELVIPNGAEAHDWKIRTSSFVSDSLVAAGRFAFERPDDGRFDSLIRELLRLQCGPEVWADAPPGTPIRDLLPLEYAQVAVDAGCGSYGVRSEASGYDIKYSTFGAYAKNRYVLKLNVDYKPSTPP